MRGLGMLGVSLALLGCLGDGGGETRPRGIPENYCAALDNMCGDANDCVAECSGFTLADGDGDDCWFYACAAAVRKCDNEDVGDKSILACMIDHDVYDACEHLAGTCDGCGARAPTRCSTVLARGDQTACLDMFIEVDYSDDGCTDGSP